MAESAAICVLISGSGSNLQAIIDAINAGKINGQIRAVISNKPDAYGLERAQKAGIDCFVIDKNNYPSRDDFNQALASQLAELNCDLIVLAGFMCILPGSITSRYHGKMINIHPSLLPKYPGLHPHRQALAAKDQQHGCTVHFVTEELDGGPIIARAALTVAPNDDEPSLQQRVLELEHQLYPLVIKWLINKQLHWLDGAVIFENNRLPAIGMQFNQAELAIAC